MKLKKSSISILIIVFLFLSFCYNNEPPVVKKNTTSDMIKYDILPIRSGLRPETTPNIPHQQINVELVPEVHQEMIRRVYTVPGIEDQPSVVLSWQGLWVKNNLVVNKPEALISDREFGHIHDDGSLHIFLEPQRASEAIEAGWAVSHPFAVQGRAGWDGFVMLYTPQSIEELNVTFQLIVDSFNYVTGQELVATDYYN